MSNFLKPFYIKESIPLSGIGGLNPSPSAIIAGSPYFRAFPAYLFPVILYTFFTPEFLFFTPVCIKISINISFKLFNNE